MWTFQLDVKRLLNTGEFFPKYVMEKKIWPMEKNLVL